MTLSAPRTFPRVSRHIALATCRTLMFLAVASAFPAQAVFAQETTPPPAASEQAAAAAPGKLETVIVTAQRRSENIKDVPMAITTLRGERLNTLTAGGQDIRFLSSRTR
jgi:iron complex outermembrane receptor protein